MPKRIRADGNEYTFTPGENGSLTAFPINPKPAPNPLAYTPKVKAKVVPRKGIEGLVKTLTGSERG